MLLVLVCFLPYVLLTVLALLGRLLSPPMPPLLLLGLMLLQPPLVLPTQQQLCLIVQAHPQSCLRHWSPPFSVQRPPFCATMTTR